MEDGKPSRTAEAINAARVFGSYLYRDAKILSDPFARLFMRPHLQRRFAWVERLAKGPLRRMVRNRLESLHPGAMGWSLVRHRYIDDQVQEAVDKGVRQMVLIGAGYDTRSIRIGMPAGMRVVELDHPDTQAVKTKILVRQLGSLPQNVSFVPADAIAGVGQLDESIFKRHEPAIFVLEGFLWYLPPDAARAVLKSISDLATPGTIVIFDYVLPSVVRGDTAAIKGATKHRAMSARLGEPILSGIDPAGIVDYLAGVGLELVGDIDHTDLAARYGSVPMHSYFRIATAAVSKKRSPLH